MIMLFAKTKLRQPAGADSASSLSKTVGGRDMCVLAIRANWQLYGQIIVDTFVTASRRRLESVVSGYSHNFNKTDSRKHREFFYH